ncbi:MAG: GTP-binding protein [Streptosporangiales bacterium]|nr:GTP-binding protein [Streptosporangiales bacterium]
MRRGVTVLSGFLGSGKTTFLRAALRGRPDSAVIVNEYGEAGLGPGLDHALVEMVAEAPAIVGGGCACCTKRDELARAMLHRLDLEERARSPRTSRLVIETSGLADPAPILFTIQNDPVLRHHYAVEEVCVTVDAVNGWRHLDRQPESVKQVAAADRLVVTKIDLAEDDAVDALVERLRRLNPAAGVDLAAGGEVVRTLRGPGAPAAPARRPAPTGDAGHEAAHVADVSAVSLGLDGPVDWGAFGVWLTMLLHAHGEGVLRVKGVLEARDVGRVAVNGVQHVIHPPEHLADESIGRGLVVIGRGIDADLVRRSFGVFQSLEGE